MALAPEALAVPPHDKRKRVPLRVIRALVKHIAEQFDPDEIILFGSHAYGRPKPWSDVDLLVVKDIPEGTELKAAAEIHDSFPRPDFSLDILVRSRAVIERRKALGDWFLREITGKGKVMYRRKGADSYRVEPAGQAVKETPTPNPLTEEWVGLAEEDIAVSRLTLQGTEAPIPWIACFHAEQCVEKYLKAYLTEKQIEFPRTHELGKLTGLCAQADGEFLSLQGDLTALERCAVAVRYPGSKVTLAEAEQTLAAAARVRAFVRGKLGLG